MKSLPVYWKHVLTVLGGTLGAQALPLLAAPLITRLCSPADMGVFSVWFGMVAVTAVAATLRLEAALILDRNRYHQRIGLGVVAWAAAAIALAASAAVAIAHVAGVPLAARIPWFGIAALAPAVWLTAYMQSTLAYATSQAAFGKAAHAKIWSAGSIALVQVALLAAGAGAAALLLGQVAGLAVGLLAATLLVRPPRPALGWRPHPQARRYLRRHAAFWQFSLPSNLLNALVGQLPLFMIGTRHGALAAGLFALTQRVLTAPIALLASSVLEVFKRESVLAFRAQGNCRAAYLYTFKTLFLLGAGPSVLLLLLSPPLFVWVFGEEWRRAGELAQIMAPLYFLNFIASPLSYVFFVAGKQKIDLVWQVALFLMTVTVFTLPGSLEQSVTRYVLGYSILYLIYLRMSYQCSGKGVALA
ncbi:MAG: lipopolysaccharide biosynthesis protein [Gammaproteobacteria bacterium]